MFVFNRVDRIEPDRKGNYYVWVVFIDNADGEERNQFLFLDHLPTQTERTALIVKLRNELNSNKYPPSKPVWNGDLPDNVKQALINRGVYKVKFNDNIEIDLLN